MVTLGYYHENSKKKGPNLAWPASLFKILALKDNFKSLELGLGRAAILLAYKKKKKESSQI